jgi:hypothetical protein
MEEEAKKKKKKTKKGPNVVKTPFGLVYKNMSSEQRQIMSQLLFSATDPSQHGHLPQSIFHDGPTQGRQLPKYDIKDDHLFIKGINLTKSLVTGKWEISLVDTNQGQFLVSEEQNSRINQQELGKIVNHLRTEVFEEDLKAFLQNEKDK